MKEHKYTFKLQELNCQTEHFSVTKDLELYFKKIIFDTAGVPVVSWQIDTVKGQDLLPALGVVIDPPCCFCRFGDDTIHVTPHMPGDNPRSGLVLHKGQVSNLYSKGKQWNTQLQKISPVTVSKCGLAKLHLHGGHRFLKLHTRFLRHYANRKVFPMTLPFPKHPAVP